MSQLEEFVPSPMFLSESAVAKIRQLVEEEESPELKLRVYVTGGGCSGFQYGFSFDQEVREDDTLVEKNGAALVVDSLSFQYLYGSRVDYEEGLAGARFTVSNPNATTTCGCGASFSV